MANSKGIPPPSCSQRGVGAVFAALLLSLGFLQGCSAGPDFVRPEAPAAKHYNNGGDPAETLPVNGRLQRFESGAELVASWWQLFNSPQLDLAVSEALAGNPGLQAAEASLLESQDNLRAGSGIFYPQLSAQFSQSRQKSSPAAVGSGASGTIFNLTTLSASVSYALDLFGGQRRAVEGLSAQVDQERALTLGTYMMLSGNIVNTCVAIAACRDEIEAAGELIALQKEQIAIAQKQYQAGLTPYGAKLALQGQLASLEASLPPLKQQLSQAEHLLATLEGKLPADFRPPEIRMAQLELPRKLPLSLPSELVRQRPDILAAEARLHAASAGIGVATAALFPSFTLNASYGRNSKEMSTLMENGSSVWGVAGSAVAPLFNGGTLAARRRASIDAYQKSLALYRQTLLAAFAQVADVIRALEHDAELAAIEARALESARLSMDLLRANYQAGMVNYPQVLIADIQYHQARIGYIQAEARQLQDSAALFVALGGGWPDDSVAKKKAALDVNGN
ncbi:MAG: efflux transporter outer membrane subunit [Chlorobiaceae bacterium]